VGIWKRNQRILFEAEGNETALKALWSFIQARALSCAVFNSGYYVLNPLKCRCCLCGMVLSLFNFDACASTYKQHFASCKGHAEKLIIAKARLAAYDSQGAGMHLPTLARAELDRSCGEFKAPYRPAAELVYAPTQGAVQRVITFSPAAASIWVDLCREPVPAATPLPCAPTPPIISPQAEAMPQDAKAGELVTVDAQLFGDLHGHCGLDDGVEVLRRGNEGKGLCADLAYFCAGHVDEWPEEKAARNGAVAQRDERAVALEANSEHEALAWFEDVLVPAGDSAVDVQLQLRDSAKNLGHSQMAYMAHYYHVNILALAYSRVVVNPSEDELPVCRRIPAFT
jgi:hypothetical protein